MQGQEPEHGGGNRRAIGQDLPEDGGRQDRHLSGTESDHVAAFWDLMPTLLDVAGVPAVEGIDGVSFARELRGQAPLRRETPLYWELGNLQAIRMGDWKLVRRTNKKGVTTTMLFDLASDVGEQTNLAGERPEVLARMLELARANRTESAVFESVYDDGR